MNSMAIGRRLQRATDDVAREKNAAVNGRAALVIGEGREKERWVITPVRSAD